MITINVFQLIEFAAILVTCGVGFGHLKMSINALQRRVEKHEAHDIDARLVKIETTLDLVLEKLQKPLPKTRARS